MIWSLLALPYLVYAPAAGKLEVQVQKEIGHGWVLVDLTPQQAESLRARGVPVDPNLEVRLSYVPSDPWWQDGSQWNLWVIRTDEAWNRTLGSPAVRVGLVDQGVDYSHPDLKVDGGRDLVDGDTDVLPADPSEFHGTHVAGIIIGQHNAVGMAGVAPDVRFYAVRAFSQSTTTLDLVVQGIFWLVDSAQVHVINLSLGTSQSAAILDSAVAYALSRNVVIVAAAGNEGSLGVNYPARSPGVIAVGAMDSLHFRADYSNWGPELDVMALGTGILSAYPCNPPGSGRNCMGAYADGTSMATPHVTGLVALYLSLQPTATVTEVVRAIRRATVDLNDPGFDERTGFGLVDAALLLSPPVRLRIASRDIWTAKDLRDRAFLFKTVFDRQGRRVFAGRGVPRLHPGVYTLVLEDRTVRLVIP